MGYGEAEDAICKDCHHQSQACTGNAGRPDIPIRQVGGGKLGSLIVPELWDMNLEPRERREHRKTGPGPPGLLGPAQRQGQAGYLCPV